MPDDDDNSLSNKDNNDTINPEDNKTAVNTQQDTAATMDTNTATDATTTRDTKQDTTPDAEELPDAPDVQEDPETPDAQGDTAISTSTSSAIQAKDYAIMKGIVDLLADAQDVDGNYITASFQRVVNKRLLPDYYHVIKFPTAFSTARQKIIKKSYNSWKEFVRDFALISHNAQVYNRPSAPVYGEANKLRELFQLEMAKLVDSGVVTAEDAQYPDLGPLPVAEDSPPPDPQAQPEESDKEEPEEEEEEEEEDETDDDKPKKKGRRGVRSSIKGTVSKSKDEKEEKEDAEPNKVRGRPPKVHTPLEARINNVLKGIRKFKHPTGELKILPFERLPDKTTLPDYYQEIKNPIALDLIKRKAKRKKYPTIEAALKDLDTMFDNAKQYNEDSSQVYKDAVELQKESRDLVEQEKNRPDSEFADEDGRLPLSEIVHNGETWKVGDWVHLTNANDPTKPIVSQIYRTWQDASGQMWINACWYYRPEQTVHRFDKMFFENEVMKTGRYLDHQVEDIVDRCFVMFITRYGKGRPRGFPSDKEIYVCEARYNEEKFKLNKIKTWASCVPDEVREKDYEMDLFDTSVKLKKHPSPIKHLLQDDAKETDPLPKPTWGASNAPPIVGAVHNAPREPNDSPPPSPTPSPAPPTPVPAPRQIVSERPYDNQGDVEMGNTAPARASAPMASLPLQPSYSGQQFNGPRISPSPAPTLQHHNSYGSQNGVRSTPVQQHAQPSYNRNPSYSQQAYTPQQSTYNQQTASIAPPQPSYTPTAALPPQPILPPASQNSYRPLAQTNNSHAMSYVPPTGPVNPQPEVYHLPDAADRQIASEIKQKFHVDDQGRVLWFTAPPAAVNSLPEKTRKGLSPSLKYLAVKLRKEKDARDAGITDGIPKSGETIAAHMAEVSAKRQKINDDRQKAEAQNTEFTRLTNETDKTSWTDADHARGYGENTVQELQDKALKQYCERYDAETDLFYQRHWGTEWREHIAEVERKLVIQQAEARANKEFLETEARKRKEAMHWKW